MEKRKQAWLIIFGSVLFLGALLFGKTIITPKPVCDPSIKSKTVILLDHSEGVPTQTMNEIVDRAWEMIDKEVPEGELVSVFSLDKLSKRDFKPSFSACKPRIDGSRTTEDIRRIRRDFEDKFKKPLMTALAAPISGADESAIAQALIDLSLDDVRFRSNDVTRLSIFSDFLENTPGFSMYKCTNPAGAVSQFRASRLGGVERPTFRNVDIRMHIIPRYNVLKPMLQCRDHFWLWFFGDNQGSCKRAACLNPDNLPG